MKTNPERAYGKAQSRGGDANTVLEAVFGFLLYRGVSVSFEQCVLMQDVGCRKGNSTGLKRRGTSV